VARKTDKIKGKRNKESEEEKTKIKMETAINGGK